MTTIKVHTVAFTGVEAVPVEVEVQKTKGLFGKVSIVGLPGGAVRESRDRVRAAIISSGFPYPRSALVINLAPADLRKEGPSFDLPLALGILATSKVVSPDALKGLLVIGELALDGRVKPVPGVLAAAIKTRQAGFKGIVVAAENLPEARMVQDLKVIATTHLRHAVSLLGGPPAPEMEGPDPDGPGEERDLAGPGGDPMQGLNYRDILGQETAKRAMVVAAGGGHNLLMIGPPGSGKTMLAKRLPTILPPLEREDALEVSRIHSFAQGGLKRLIHAPPFRAPHHTVSYAGLVGGCGVPRPGEVSLAHKGVLFLDELPEFGRRTLEALRQPLEEGVITIARARSTITLPAKISLVAAMNPCPCGFNGDPRRPCRCTPYQAALYLKRLSGPLLDRLDLQIDVPTLDPELFQTGRSGGSSEEMAAEVLRARKIQGVRNGDAGTCLNAHLTAEQIRAFCRTSRGAARFLGRYLERYPLSARGYSKILKVARTVADLQGEELIREAHVSQATMFRCLDRANYLEES